MTRIPEVTRTLYASGKPGALILPIYLNMGRCSKEHTPVEFIVPVDRVIVPEFTWVKITLIMHEICLCSGMIPS